jgi:hypothetical protein
VPLDAHTFAITNRQGETIALPVVCVEARYASLRRAGEQRIERLHATPAQWKTLQADPRSGDGLAFLESEGHRAQWLHTLPVEAETPHAAAVGLDNHLRSQSMELRLQLRIRQE